MNDKGMIAPYLGSSLDNLFKPENKSHFRLKEDLYLTGMNVFSMIEGIPITLFNTLLTF